MKITSHELILEKHLEDSGLEYHFEGIEYNFDDETTLDLAQMVLGNWRKSMICIVNPCDEGGYLAMLISGFFRAGTKPASFFYDGKVEPAKFLEYVKASYQYAQDQLEPAMEIIPNLVDILEKGEYYRLGQLD